MLNFFQEITNWISSQETKTKEVRKPTTLFNVIIFIIIISDNLWTFLPENLVFPSFYTTQPTDHFLKNVNISIKLFRKWSKFSPQKLYTFFQHLLSCFIFLHSLLYNLFKKVHTSRKNEKQSIFFILNLNYKTHLRKVTFHYNFQSKTKKPKNFLFFPTKWSDIASASFPHFYCLIFFRDIG